MHGMKIPQQDFALKMQGGLCAREGIFAGHYSTCIYTQIPYFFNQTLWLLFFSLLVLCGYYSRVVFISLESPRRSTMAG